jgi:hypothetical protein
VEYPRPIGEGGILVSAKLRRNVLKKGIALGRRYRFGSLHQPIEIVIWKSQSQLVQGGHGRACFPSWMDREGSALKSGLPPKL